MHEIHLYTELLLMYIDKTIKLQINDTEELSKPAIENY